MNAVYVVLARDEVDLSVRGWRGQKLLLSAARQEKRIGVLRAFLTREDLNVNIRDDFGLSPLFYIIGNGSQKAVQLFLARDDVEVNVMDDSDQTPLSLAVDFMNADAVQLLLTREDIDLGPGKALISAAEASFESYRSHYPERVERYGGIANLLRSHLQQYLARNGSQPTKISENQVVKKPWDVAFEEYAEYTECKKARVFFHGELKICSNHS
ncbi:hypothetical protein ABVK25_006578 [Lepraria finkii]|uniref:Uncharacterized protein n=1 Tax=Lepraria finkii TaxID=1340010 RepID=A0ABR4B743_9LECA